MLFALGAEGGKLGQWSSYIKELSAGYCVGCHSLSQSSITAALQKAVIGQNKDPRFI